MRSIFCLLNRSSRWIFNLRRSRVVKIIERIRRSISPPLAISSVREPNRKTFASGSICRIVSRIICRVFDVNSMIYQYCQMAVGKFRGPIICPRTGIPRTCASLGLYKDIFELRKVFKMIIFEVIWKLGVVS